MAGLLPFPIGYEQEYFNQLTREQVRTRFVRGHLVRYWFKPSGKRNEALDPRVYALATLHARPVPWEVLLRAAPTEPHAPPIRFERRRIRFKIGRHTRQWFAGHKIVDKFGLRKG